MLVLVTLLVVAQSVVALPPIHQEKIKNTEEVALQDDEVHPDTGLSIFELIEKYNYPIERHGGIQTEDGYILELHRIPYGVKSGPAENRPAVLLVHGIIMSSVDFVNMGPERGLGFLLADLGYDVWMGNARGTTYSRKHVSLDPDDDKKDFWDFSWNEIGIYDLPAMIDYILEQTNQEKLYYIGHSQGTTTFFVMGAERPDYNDKIRLMVALAPAAYMNHVNNPILQFLALFDDTIEVLASIIGMYEFLPNIDLISGLGTVLCKDGALFQELCSSAIFLLCGWDSEQLDRHMFTVILTNTPAGAATKQLLHYAQGIRSGDFKKYGLGIIQNLIEYGSVNPPSYGISNIRAPIALFYSKNDLMVDTIDVERFAPQLPNLVYQYLVPFDKFNHLDFMWAIDVIPLVYNEVFRILGEH